MVQFKPTHTVGRLISHWEKKEKNPIYQLPPVKLGRKIEIEIFRCMTPENCSSSSGEVLLQTLFHIKGEIEIQR